MYTEVKEVVNFLCRYINGRVPRRPTGIFAAELGNYLVAQFASTWDTKNPMNGEYERCISVNCADGSSKCFESSTGESGLDLAEVLECLPDRIKLYVNPGVVYLTANDGGIKVPLWNGDVDADLNYSPFPNHIVKKARDEAAQYTNLGAAGKNTVIPPKKPLTKNESTQIELMGTFYVPLKLEKTDEMNSNLSHLQEMYPYCYVYKPTSTATFSGLSFSHTRFGSSKPRPDLQTMLNIKQLSSQELPTLSSSSSNSPTFEHQLATAHAFSYFKF